VVTRPERGVRRGKRGSATQSPVRVWAQQHSLPLMDPPSINDQLAIEQLNSLNADLMVVCDYGQILSSQALATTRLGGINLHGSLLPAYRGASPVQSSLLAGDRRTGVSVIHMTPRLDGGPILASAELEIRDDETAGDLEQRLSELGVQPTLDAIRTLDTANEGNALGIPQDASKISRAPRLKKDDGRIDWSQTCRMVDCHVRGMQPWPIAFIDIDTGDGKPTQRVQILGVSTLVLGPSKIFREDQTVQALIESTPTGHVVTDWQQSGKKSRLLVRCADGVMEIIRVRPQGKREMTAEEYMRGRPIPPGTNLNQNNKAS
ncbi:MAG: methionyl-tRNA formyltransferase, partial [Planctomycetota bacterium]